MQLLKLKILISEEKIFSAEGQNRNDINGFSDRRRDHLGYLGQLKRWSTTALVVVPGFEPGTSSTCPPYLVDPRGFEPLTFAM